MQNNGLNTPPTPKQKRRNKSRKHRAQGFSGDSWDLAKHPKADVAIFSSSHPKAPNALARLRGACHQRGPVRLHQVSGAEQAQGLRSDLVTILFREYLRSLDHFSGLGGSASGLGPIFGGRYHPSECWKDHGPLDPASGALATYVTHGQGDPPMVVVVSGFPLKRPQIEPLKRHTHTPILRFCHKSCLFFRN